MKDLEDFLGNSKLIFHWTIILGCCQKMLKLDSEQQNSIPLTPFSYIQSRKILGPLILPFTRWYRAYTIEKYMKPAERHLDIGCGDGYFLKRSKAKERYGLDKLLGDNVKDKLDFPDSYFDYVTLLAVLEHLENPRSLMKEIARVLKPQGKLLMTTPKKMADCLIKLYAHEIDKEHVAYYTFKDIEDLTKDFFKVIRHHRFIFGLNQIFCLEKNR